MELHNYKPQSELFQKWYADGEVAGIEKGIEKGIAQGIEKGERRSLLLVARRLMTAEAFARVEQLTSIDALRAEVDTALSKLSPH